MSFELLAAPAVILVAITAVSLLVSFDWRLSIGMLGVQYLGVFILVAQHWPPEMAVVKLVAGWIAAAVLGMGMVSQPAAAPVGSEPGTAPPEKPAGRAAWTGLRFHLMAAVLVLLTIYTLITPATTFLPGISMAAIWGGFILIGMGLLQLGFTATSFATTLGLLTFLSGFEILYAAVESSTLVAGLLAGIHLILALVGAYLLVSPQMEAVE